MTDPIWPISLAILGAIVGSFLATLAIRWPAERSVLRGRSQCDGCGKTLGAAELVPLVSALALRGRCRACGARIDPRHWLIEAGAAIVGASAGLVAPGPAGAAGAVFGWLLLTLAAIDAAELWLPEELTLAVAVSGLAAAWLVPVPPLVDRLIGAGVGYLCLWAVSVIYGAIRDREVMGEGDPKLLLGIGAWLGWAALPYVLVFACVFGLGLAAVSRLRGASTDWATEMPFGTFLAIAAYPAWLVVIASTP